jgi:hypothetical protein
MAVSLGLFIGVVMNVLAQLLTIYAFKHLDEVLRPIISL